MNIRQFLSNQLRKLCQLAVGNVPADRTIFNKMGNRIYLEKWYGYGGLNADGAFKKTFCKLAACLHHFRESDDSTALHNHPFYGVSLILAGGYSEQRRTWGDRVVRRLKKPLTLNFLRPGTYHRVDLLENDCWTLFISWQVRRHSWYFWQPSTGRTLGWREYLAESRNLPFEAVKDLDRSEQIPKAAN